MDEKRRYGVSTVAASWIRGSGLRPGGWGRGRREGVGLAILVNVIHSNVENYGYCITF